MPHVVIAGMAARRFTGGASEFDVEADTVRRMIVELDRRFPGLGNQIDEGMAVSIDGTLYQDAYMARLEHNSEVVLIPKIGGG
jgi:sulfur-carrier protein